jgi:DNA-binding CsgD family transcriptional regulator
VLDAARPLDLRGLRRGIDMRIVRERRVLDDPANRRYLLELAAHGAGVRLLPAATHRMLIMDDEVAVVPIDQRQMDRGALVVRHPVLLAGFRDIFQRAWDEAVDLDVVEGGAVEDELSETERALLQQLLRGVTDDVAARELGISTRHLRRQLTRLFDRLEAQSRFAAGAEAARRQWI